MKASLVLVQTDLSQREIALNKPRIVIGRDTSCQIRVPVSAVSRQHCEVVADGARVLIRDLKSSNGTFVNRQRVTESELHAGDIVSIGPAVFAVRVDGKPVTIDSESTLKAGAIPSAPAPTAAAPAKSGASKSPASTGKSSGLLDDLDLDDLDDDDEPTARKTSTPQTGGAKPGAKSGGKPAKPGKPAKADGESGNEDSSVSDFDFLDDEEDEQPKL